MNGRIFAGAGIILAGVAGFLVFLLSRIGGAGAVPHRFEAPGEVILNLDRGPHTLYWEPSGLFQAFPADLTSTVTAMKTGRDVPLGSTLITRTYSLDGRRGVSQSVFDIPEDGSYLVKARYPYGKKGEKVSLAVAAGGLGGLLVTVLGCIAILGGSIGAGVALILAGVKKRT